MTNLTLQDVDNFEIIVNHCQASEAQLKLSFTNRVWHLTVTQDYVEGSHGWVKHGHELTEVLQMAADEIKSQDDTPDTIENAVRLPAMHTYPDPELLRRSGMHAAAAEAQRLRRLDKGLAPDEEIFTTRTGRFNITPPEPQPVPRFHGLTGTDFQLLKAQRNPTEQAEYIEDQLGH